MILCRGDGEREGSWPEMPNMSYFGHSLSLGDPIDLYILAQLSVISPSIP